MLFKISAYSRFHQCIRVDGDATLWRLILGQSMSIVEEYYNQNSETEWERLEKHRTEFAVTMRALSDYLPPAPATILDIGGGPGRYAIELTKLGYTVTLADLSEANLSLAKQHAQAANVTLAHITKANALDLSAFEAAPFDSVLLLGPLYHLLDESERREAVTQSRRVLKANGVLFAAFITRFASFRDSSTNFPDWPVDNWDYAKHILETGKHEDPKGGFTNAYFALPEEVRPLMENCGLETLNLVGCEGVVAGHDQVVNTFEGAAWERWVDLNYRLGQEPSLYGASDHLLYIGRKNN